MSLSGRPYVAVVAVVGAALVGFGAPSWLALLAGLAIALISGSAPPKQTKQLTTLALQGGVVFLGAGMNLEEVWRVGSSGALLTAAGLATALALGLILGRILRVPGDTPLLVAVGTAICGGSAIAAVASVIKPKEHELSVSLAVVFILNALGLLIFPAIGHALGLDEPTFGRWAALAIHDTSSVVGAGKDYGKIALQVATTTKLARALWIVPVTIAIAIASPAKAGRAAAPEAVRSDNAHRDPESAKRGSLRGIRWPYFILGFVATAALATWVPDLADVWSVVKDIGTRSLVAALFLIGLSLSRSALQKVGVRPLVLGVLLWVIIGTAALALVVETA